ncbi:MAG: translation initiation factor IF-2 [Candidatus Omnitrophica bacterium]|nr:translation initiation factor IF-2 [Candidatus Omnitrophota bacterium]
MRVHELAKKLKVSSKELIEDLKKHGVKVKTHMELLDAKVVETILKKSAAHAKPKVVSKIKAAKQSEKKVKTEKAPVKHAVHIQPAKPAHPVIASSPKGPLRGAKQSEPPSSPNVLIGDPQSLDSKPKVVSSEPIGIPGTPERKVERVTAPAEVKKPAIQVEMPITVGALAEKLGVRPAELIKSLIGLGIFANVNQLLSEEIIWKASKALNIPIEKIEDKEAKAVFEESEEDPKKLRLRPPVVTMMGHVDHGKTSLLDAIRKSNVADQEAGQITQHIGAYGVEIAGKGHVTFVDTPGHEAFTAMRARGANVTDVVVLVVAADDGVMPQTIEAVDHATAAGCPIVVAINKSDLPAADPERVMGGLQKLGLMPEEWGGKTICVKVSAKTGKGIDELLEMLLLEAEVLELKANPDRPAQGTVLEAKLSKGQGSVATVLVQNGTLHVGDLIVVGPHCGRVRALRNDRGKNVKEAKPSYAAEVLGLSGTPEAGEIFTAVSDEKIARKIAEKRSLEIRERAMKGFHLKHLSLEELYSQMKEGRVKELKLIIKADVQGSVEVLTQSMEQAVSEQIKVRVIHGGVGGINESDIMLAAASDAIVIGFHVKSDERAQALVEKEGVDARFYNIIYEAVEDVRKAMEGLLEPTMKEVVEGRTEVQQIFQSSRVGAIGGAIVRKGKLARNHHIRVIRNNIVVHTGKLSSLKRFKDDVREVQEGYDCGVVVEGFGKLQEGDILESYRVEKVAGKLV